MYRDERPRVSSALTVPASAAAFSVATPLTGATPPSGTATRKSP